MALITIPDTDTFDQWRQKTELIASKQGDLDLLQTLDNTNLVNAINEAMDNIVEGNRQTLIRAIAMS